MPKVVEVPVPAYQPLPTQLTTRIDQPAPPAKHCTWKGLPAVCALDGLATIPQYQGKLDQANADRETAARITAKTGEP
ncbi:hypothetical protein [Dyella sp. 20L07]|uniref:hypothetical protein n=1 Tax=Dyella sp. 20L07 TaxID=3384240 RepID=UPI003D28F7C1